MKYLHPVVLTVFAAIPYALVTWGYTKLTNGDGETFCIALGVLLGIRLFFYSIETLGDVLSWRIYRRKIAVDNALMFFRSNGFPPRRFSHDDLSNYLARIEDDPQWPETLRKSAVDIYRYLAMIEQLGILVGARTWAVWEEALDIFAPRSEAIERLS